MNRGEGIQECFHLDNSLFIWVHLSNEAVHRLATYRCNQSFTSSHCRHECHLFQAFNSLFVQFVFQGPNDHTALEIWKNMNCVHKFKFLMDGKVMYASLYVYKPQREYFE